MFRILWLNISISYSYFVTVVMYFACRQPMYIQKSRLDKRAKERKLEYLSDKGGIGFDRYTRLRFKFVTIRRGGDNLGQGRQPSHPIFFRCIKSNINVVFINWSLLTLNHNPRIKNNLFKTIKLVILCIILKSCFEARCNSCTLLRSTWNPLRMCTVKNGFFMWF